MQLHLHIHMQIRYATINDVYTLVQNNILLAKESENEILIEENAIQGVKNLLSDPKKGFYLVVEENNTIIGQLMITFEWSDWRNADIWWIQSVYIHKDYRMKGVFSLLFDKIRKEAKKHNVPKLRLYVHKSNKSAQRVYEKLDMKKGTYIMYETPITPKK